MAQEARIRAAMRDVFQDTRSVLEPAGALAVAGAKLYAECEGIENETLIAITSGANMSFDRLSFVRCGARETGCCVETDT